MSTISGYRGSEYKPLAKKELKSLHDSASSLELSDATLFGTHKPAFGQMQNPIPAEHKLTTIPEYQKNSGLSPFQNIVQRGMAKLLNYMPDSLRNKLEHQNLFAGHYRKDLATSIETLKTLYPKLPILDRIEEVQFESDKGQKHLGWFVPPQDDKPTILHSMGNVSSLTTILRFQPLMDAGYGFMSYEYPGYGSTEGRPTEESINKAGRAASDFLKYKKHIPRSQQVFYGISLGGTVTATLAREFPCRAVIMESTMTCFPDVAKRKVENFTASWLVPMHEIAENQMNSERKLRNVTDPVLVMHGTKDSLMPFNFAERLHKSAGSKEGRKELIPFPRQGHNIDTGYTIPHIMEFLKSLPPVSEMRLAHERTIDALDRATKLCLEIPPSFRKKVMSNPEARQTDD